MVADDLLTQAFQRGLDMARDPLNARCAAPDESRTTTMYSPWLLRLCPRCHHTFREDDLVRPHPDFPDRPDRMLHEDPRAGLLCWSRVMGHTPPLPPEAVACSLDMRAAFLHGLEQHWKPAGNRDTSRLVLVAHGSPLVGRKCPVCRHTVRPGDLVLPCPCGTCGGVFHQDVTRHLTCWDTWVRGYVRPYCAFTGAPLPKDDQRASE